MVTKGSIITNKNDSMLEINTTAGYVIEGFQLTYVSAYKDDLDEEEEYYQDIQWTELINV